MALGKHSATTVADTCYIRFHDILVMITAPKTKIGLGHIISNSKYGETKKLVVKAVVNWKFLVSIIVNFLKQYYIITFFKKSHHLLLTISFIFLITFTFYHITFQFS